MNKPAFSRWAMESQTNVSMESLGELLGKLKSIFSLSKKIDNNDEIKNRKEYSFKILDALKHTYGNKGWVKKQELKTEKIDIGDLNSIFNVKDKNAESILSQVINDRKNMLNLCSEYGKFAETYKKDTKVLYQKLLKLLNTKNKWEGVDFTNTEEFKNILNEFKDIKNKLLEINLKKYKVSNFDFSVQNNKYVFKYNKLESIDFSINPLTHLEISKCADEIYELVCLFSNQVYDNINDSVEGIGPFDEIDESLINVAKHDEFLQLILFEIADDGYLQRCEEIFTTFHENGFIYHALTIAIGLDKLITRSIK